MSRMRFWGSMSGKRVQDTTMSGNENTGISGHIRGWKLGGRVDVRASKGLDAIDLYLTSGSNSKYPDQPILTATLQENGDIKVEIGTGLQKILMADRSYTYDHRDNKN